MSIDKRNIIILFIIIMQLTFVSCNLQSSSFLRDDTLSGFMLGGVYSIWSYGGLNTFEGIMNNAQLKTNEETVKASKRLFEFPFKKKQAIESSNVLKINWNIQNKNDLLKNIESLTTRKYKYKAWDYARITKWACLEYSAGYLSQEAVLCINQNNLHNTRLRYNNWDEYFRDYRKGNKDENVNLHLGIIAKDVMYYKQSIYSIIPLSKGHNYGQFIK